jgi:apolipoprotein N-acyltransferase
MAVVRAAENHRPLLRASNAGICLTTDPFGRVLGSSKLFERTLFTSEVLLSAGTKTLYLRWGSWLPKICWLLMCLIAIVAVRKNHPTISNPEEKVSVPVLQDPPFHP